MGSTKWPHDSGPYKPNEEARKRVEALTIYDSTRNQETVLSNTTTLRAGNIPAATFVVIMAGLFLATCIML